LKEFFNTLLTMVHTQCGDARHGTVRVQSGSTEDVP